VKNAIRTKDFALEGAEKRSTTVKNVKIWLGCLSTIIESVAKSVVD